MISRTLFMRNIQFVYKINNTQEALTTALTILKHDNASGFNFDVVFKCIILINRW